MIASRQIADRLWIVDGPVVRWFTMPFPTRMTIARLDDGSLWIHSPIPPTPEVCAFVLAIGTPRYVVSPNKLHHLFLPAWKATFPDVRLFAPPELREKRRDIAFDGDLGDAPDVAWAGEIDQLLFAGSRSLDEIVFCHRASRTAIFGDLIENFDPATLSPLHRWIARVGGVLAPRGATPRDLRFSFRGRHADARDALRRIVAWQPRAIVMSHGVPVFENAGAFLDTAFSWLDA